MEGLCEITISWYISPSEAYGLGQISHLAWILLSALTAVGFHRPTFDFIDGKEL